MKLRQPSPRVSSAHVRLGLRANAAQFSVLVGLNALVGAMVGLERSMLPLVGERDFGLSSKGAILTFIVAFGATKALTNLGAGTLADRIGRAAGAVADRTRTELGLGRGREPPARGEPGPHLVDDRRDEDRPRRPAAPGGSRSG